MPGGATTLTNSLPDLESFLTRRRIPLKVWLDSKSITTTEAFNLFLITNSLWTISQNLVDQVQELLKPVIIPVKPEIAPVEPVAAVVETVANSSELVIISNVQEVIEQPNEDLAVTVPEEPVQMVEEVSVVSSHQSKERKKIR